MNIHSRSFGHSPKKNTFSDAIPAHIKQLIRDDELYRQYCEFLDKFFILPVPDPVKDLFTYLYTSALKHHHTEENPQRASLSAAFSTCYQFGIMKQLPYSMLQDRIFACTFRNIFDNVFNIEATITSGSTYDLWRKISANSGYDPEEPAWPEKKEMVENFLKTLCPKIPENFSENGNEAETKTHRRHHKK